LTYFGYSQTENTKFAKENYSIRYPKSWNLDTSKLMGTECFIFSPIENDSDKFKENISVVIQNLAGQNINLERYKNITEEQISTIATDGKVYESTMLKSDTDKYYKITYGMTQGKFKLKITSICYINNSKAYLITFTSELDKYYQYKEIAEEILNSFVVIK
jgi:serine/threonine-protein kinase